MSMNASMTDSSWPAHRPPAPDDQSIAARARQKARRRRISVLPARQLSSSSSSSAPGSCSVTRRSSIRSSSARRVGIVERLADWMMNGTAYGSFWLQIWITLEESLLGFAFGVGSGIVLGVLLGEIPFLADVIGPYIKIVNALPRIVLGSIFIMWLGLGLPSKVMLAAVLVFFVVFFNAFQGVRSVDRNLVANARILGATRLQVVRHVVFPSAMTWIIASLHVALGFSIIGAIVGEFLGAQKGLGLVIATAQNTFDANGVFGAMIVIGVLALGAEGADGACWKSAFFPGSRRPPRRATCQGLKASTRLAGHREFASQPHPPNRTRGGAYRG